MELKQLTSGLVFIDTSILILAFTNTRYTKTCEDFLARSKYGGVEGYINSTVLDEFFHKLLIFEVYSKKKLTSQDAIKFLKGNPDFFKSLDKPFKASKEVLKEYRFKILDTSKLLEEALDISREYGLLFSDALHSACCKVYGIENIATSDADFERVNFLKVWKPCIGKSDYVRQDQKEQKNGKSEKAVTPILLLPALTSPCSRSLLLCPE